jgi:hypothetical protein
MMPRITQITDAHDNSYCDEDACYDCKEHNDDDENDFE